MISVLSNEANQAVVREFFELFKTPWQLHEPGAPAGILIVCGVEAPADAADMTIVFGAEKLAVDGPAVRNCEPKDGGIFREGGIELPVHGRSLVDNASGTILYREDNSQRPRRVRVGFDLFAEVRHLISVGQPANHAAIPALELHIQFLRGLILRGGFPLVEVPPRPAGHDFIACLTHDVDHVGIRNHKFDHTMFGFLYRATVGSMLDVCSGKRKIRQLSENLSAALRLPLVHLGLARDFWYQFDHYTALEAGRPSTYFVIPKKGDAGLDVNGQSVPHRAASYDAADLKVILQQLETAGKEVTVHGLDAWRDVGAGRDERGRIGGLVNRPADGIRMHWLYFDAAAPEKLEAAGYVYDSTVGYNETVGYRAGTVQVFKPLATRNLVELPMHIMDTALFYPSYLNLSPAQAGKTVQPLMDNAVRFGGVLTINWHDRSIAPERLWGDFYEQLIAQMQAKNAWFATAAQAVMWFRRRRSATFEKVAVGRIKIKLPPADDTRLPALRVRIYQPGTGGADASYSEQVVRDGSEMSLAD